VDGVVSLDREQRRQSTYKNRVDDIELPNIHPRKAFIVAALDKEIRLSFAQRIKGTLPEPYQPLISVEKEKDTPDFKFNGECKAFYGFQVSHF
jgi:nuclear cap-binding protein subunit 1